PTTATGGPDPARRRRPRTTGCPSKAPFVVPAGSDPDHVTRECRTAPDQVSAPRPDAQPAPRSSADQVTASPLPVDHHRIVPAARTLATPIATSDVLPLSRSYRLSPSAAPVRSVLSGTNRSISATWSTVGVASGPATRRRCDPSGCSASSRTNAPPSPSTAIRHQVGPHVAVSVAATDTVTFWFVVRLTNSTGLPGAGLGVTAHGAAVRANVPVSLVVATVPPASATDRISVVEPA